MVGVNYGWCLVIVFIFMGLPETERWGCLKSSFEGKGGRQKGAIFIGGINSSDSVPELPT